jgi:hypothetical protein
MKTAAIILLALAPAMAQIRPASVSQPAPEAAKMVSPAPAGTIPTPAKKIVTPEALKVLQMTFDGDLANYNINDPIDILGRTRGVYLSDYGVVLTTELSPIITPAITPFVQKIPEEKKLEVHKRKLDRIPVIEKIMGDMMKHAAEQLALMPDNQQIVLVVKLIYYPYEDVRDLPTQITLKGDKRSAMTGKGHITLEE